MSRVPTRTAVRTEPADDSFLLRFLLRILFRFKYSVESACSMSLLNQLADVD